MSAEWQLKVGTKATLILDSWVYGSLRSPRAVVYSANIIPENAKNRINLWCSFFYSLISSLKTYHRTFYVTLWSLDLCIHVPFQLPGEHTVLHPFRLIELIVHIAISVLPGTHFHLSQVKHLRVKCLGQGHTILTMSQD